jgi:branched-chain amino acid transport system ATP-binding protein
MAVNSLVTGYGSKQVLNGVSIDVGAGEIVALIGHNGAGKSTLLKAVFGLLPIWTGEIVLDGVVCHPEPYEMVRAGVAYVPQGNNIFKNLTVRENLDMGGAARKDSLRHETHIVQILSLYPALRSKLNQTAGTLSGGQKQLLALGIALVSSPRLLLLDEPSLGIASALVAETFLYIRRAREASNHGVIIVEQKVREVLNIADRVYIMRNGLIAFSGRREELDDNNLRQYYL